MKQLVKIFLFFLYVSLATTSVFGIPWQKADFHYFAQDDGLREMLKNFCIAQGINAVINEEVNSKVSGLFEDVSPDFFLSKVCKAYGLVWFYDGNILYIDPFHKIESKILHVQHNSAEEILNVLAALGIEGSNFSVRGLKEQGVLFLSGSPRFVSTVTELVQRLEENQVELLSRQAVQVFPLKYAWAYDLDFDQHENSLTIPGIASMLQNLMRNASSQESYTRIDKRLVSSTVHKLKGEGLAKFSGNPRKEPPYKSREVDEQNEKHVNDSEEQSGGAYATGRALIDSDIRLNAVVVKDVKSNMPLYKDLIDTLDVPVEVIAIKADIIDIDAGFSFDLGVDYVNITKKNKDFQIAPAGPGNKSFGEFTEGLNGQFVFPLSRADILAQVTFLETKGKAKMLSRPSIITLDNVEATMRRDDTVYTKVAGSYEVDLFKVNAGTTLKVTPHVIREDSHNKIKLLVAINDGTLESVGAVDGVPLVKESSINTQAVVMEGESLLLGGHFQEKHARSESGIPLLKDIPILGYLFKVSKNKDNTVQRIFLITPEIINLSRIKGPDFSKTFPAAYLDKEAAKFPIDYGSEVLQAAKRAEASASQVRVEQPSDLSKAPPTVTNKTRRSKQKQTTSVPQPIVDADVIVKMPAETTSVEEQEIYANYLSKRRLDAETVKPTKAVRERKRFERETKSKSNP